jgi:hypothetical protein
LRRTPLHCSYEETGLNSSETTNWVSMPPLLIHSFPPQPHFTPLHPPSLSYSFTSLRPPSFSPTSLHHPSSSRTSLHHPSSSRTPLHSPLLSPGGDAGDAFVLMCGDGGNDVGALKQVTHSTYSIKEGKI